MSGDSTVALGVSTAVFSQNTAAQKGGGLFISAGHADFDPSNGAGLDQVDLAKVTFWRLDLVDNASPTGDGGGVSVSLVRECSWPSIMCILDYIPLCMRITVKMSMLPNAAHLIEIEVTNTQKQLK